MTTYRSADPKRLWDNPYRGQVRLVDNGTYTPSFGRVEVHQGKHWGTVCGKNFGVGAASSACRQLGYTGAAAVGGAPRLIILTNEIAGFIIIG